MNHLLNFRVFHRLVPFFIILLLSLLFSCGDDEEGEFNYPLEGSVYSIDDISGSWVATEASLEDYDNPQNNIDIIGSGGSAILDIQTNGRFSFSASIAGAGTWSVDGQLGFSGNQLVLLADGDAAGEDEGFFAMNIIDGNFYLVGPVEFDIDFDGEEEEVQLELIMEPA